MSALASYYLCNYSPRDLLSSVAAIQVCCILQRQFDKKTIMNNETNSTIYGKRHIIIHGICIAAHSFRLDGCNDSLSSIPQAWCSPTPTSSSDCSNKLAGQSVLTHHINQHRALTPKWRNASQPKSVSTEGPSCTAYSQCSHSRIVLGLTSF